MAAATVMEGWLLKRGEYIATWRPRYFVLREDGTFRGYKNKPSPGEAPANLFDVRGCTVIVEDPAKAKSGKFGFMCRFMERTRIVERSFHTEVEAERKEWIDAITRVKRSVESSLSAPEAPQRGMSFVGGRPVPMDISLEDFDMLKVLGKGTFGKVMLAKMKSDATVYAIKILKKSMVLEKEELTHTLTENNVLAKCQHPFLTSLAYSFQTPDLLCFVMEFVNGGELFFHLRKQKAFGEDRTRFYIAEILCALTYLHSQAVIYRDLKLENLMLDSDGHIKITDFGLAKEEITFGATTNTFCGTPEYLAPEVIVDSDYGRAVDWWGMGVVAYEMITGKLPFQNRDYEKLFNLILTQEVPYPPSMSAAAQDLLGGLLNKDPQKRLGGGPGDGNDIIAHAWFGGLKMADLEAKKIPPPFKPAIKSDTDAGNFDPYFTSEKPVITPPDGSSRLTEAEKEEAFKAFESVAVSK